MASTVNEMTINKKFNEFNTKLIYFQLNEMHSKWKSFA